MEEEDNIIRLTPEPEEREKVATVILYSDGSANITTLPIDSDERRDWIRKMMHMATENLLTNPKFFPTGDT